MSSWLRDYVYIHVWRQPSAEPYRTYIALMMTMLLAAASGTVPKPGRTWPSGASRGLYPASGARRSARASRVSARARGFRAPRSSHLRAMELEHGPISRQDGHQSHGSSCVVCSARLFRQYLHFTDLQPSVGVSNRQLHRADPLADARPDMESVVARTPSAVIAAVWGLMAFAIVVSQGGGSAFIYFQF